MKDSRYFFFVLLLLLLLLLLHDVVVVAFGLILSFGNKHLSVQSRIRLRLLMPGTYPTLAYTPFFSLLAAMSDVLLDLEFVRTDLFCFLSFGACINQRCWLEILAS